MNDETQTEGEQEAPEAPELSLDDLFQEEVDAELIAQEEKELLLPNGTYVTTPPFSPQIGVDKTGRKNARFWGTISLGEVTGKIGFRLSWERRNAKDYETGQETDKPDRSYKNYLMASKAYRAAYGEPHANVGQVLAFLRDYPVRLRVIQTSDGENMVVAISAVRNS